MFALFRNRRGSDRQAPLALDEQLPRFDAVVRRHAVVEVPLETAYDAVMSADLTESGPLVTLLNSLRFLPGWIRAIVRGTDPPEIDDRLTLGDLPTEGVWVRLAESPGNEVVFGAIGQVWKPDIEWVTIDADDFRTFDRPGYAKIAATVSLRPYGEDRSLVTYEARTAGTDARATRIFLRYWTVVEPFAGYIMARALRKMKAVAESTF